MMKTRLAARRAELRTLGPGRVGAAGDPRRQQDAADRPGLGTPGVVEDALGAILDHVGDEGDEVAVVLLRRADPRREARLAAIALRPELEGPALSRLQVVFDQAREQEPARLGHRAIGVAILP